MTTAIEILQTVYGHQTFRSVQEDVIENAIAGRDTVALMGTGVGKTVCYQIPALAREGLAIVISPLKALMRDQIEALEQLGQVAETINSEITGYDRENILNAIRAGQVKFLYVTPELVAQAWFQTFAKSVKLSVIAIDEAHAASVYGNDFRPDYKLLGMLPVLFPGVPRIAVTATADPATLHDMQSVLNMNEATVFRGELDRKNIAITIAERQPQKKHNVVLKNLLAKHEGESGLIYVMGRKSVDKLTDWLIAEGYNALPYHAGMSDMDRNINQDRFSTGDVDILVCTVAFGMGIDKSDIRFVIHEDLSANIESYVQETGRAGRDGQMAYAYMFYSNGDISLRRRMIKKSNGGAVMKRTENTKLEMLLGFCETTACRRGVVLRYFGESFSGSCNNCDNCGRESEPANLIEDVREIAKAISNASRRINSYDIVEQVAMDAVKASSLVRQMVASGHLDVNHTEFSALALTGEGRRLLTANQYFANDTFSMTSAVTLPAVKKAPAKPRAATARTQTDGNATYVSRRSSKARTPKGSPLLEALRSERNAIARSERKKKFYIVHDKALQQMSVDLPRSIKELLEVKGIGEAKAERYGITFLNIIRQYA